MCPDRVVMDFACWLGYRRSSDLSDQDLLNRLVERGMTPDQAREELDRNEDESIDEFFTARFGVVGRNDDDGSKV